MRIKWALESSRGMIFADTLESRLAFQWFSAILLKRLKVRAIEMGLSWDDQYEIKAQFYLPEEKNKLRHFTYYTQTQQQQDRDEALRIYNVANLCDEKYKQGNFEFLYFLSDQDLQAALMRDHAGHPVLFHALLSNPCFAASLLERCPNIKLTNATNSQKYKNPNVPMAIVNSFHRIDRKVWDWFLKQVDVESKESSSGNTAVHFAARYGHTEIVQALITAGANLNEKNTTAQSSPLHLVAIGDHHEVAKLLLQHGANIKAKDTAEFTLLDDTAYYGSLEVAKLLFNNEKEHSSIEKIFRIAAQNGHIHYLDYLIKNQKFKFDTDKLKVYLQISLAAAEKYEQEEVIVYLIKNGAPVTSTHKVCGLPILHWAANYNHLHVIDILLKQNGININHQNEDGWTALHGATQSGHADVAKLLLQHKAQVNQQKSDGWTALQLAAVNGHINIVTVLLKHKDINVNLKDEDGHTALYLAAANGHTDIVKILLQHELNQANRLDSILKIFQALPKKLRPTFVKHATETVKRILNCGDSADVTDHKRQTALHFAAKI